MFSFFNFSHRRQVALWNIFDRCTHLRTALPSRPTLVWMQIRLLRGTLLCVLLRRVGRHDWISASASADVGGRVHVSCWADRQRKPRGVSTQGTRRRKPDTAGESYSRRRRLLQQIPSPLPPLRARTGWRRRLVLCRRCHPYLRMFHTDDDRLVHSQE